MSLLLQLQDPCPSSQSGSARGMSLIDSVADWAITQVDVSKWSRLSFADSPIEIPAPATRSPNCLISFSERSDRGVPREKARSEKVRMFNVLSFSYKSRSPHISLQQFLKAASVQIHLTRTARLAPSRGLVEVPTNFCQERQQSNSHQVRATRLALRRGMPTCVSMICFSSSSVQEPEF